MSKPTDKYEWVSPEEQKTIVDIAEKVYDVLEEESKSDDDTLMLCWIALVLNVKRLGEVILEKATIENFKTQLTAYLEKTDEWIITRDKINRIN